VYRGFARACRVYNVFNIAPTGRKGLAAEFTKYAIWLFSPLGLWLTLLLSALSGFWGRRRLKRVVLVLAHLQLLLFSLPWVGDALLGGLEREAAQLEAQRPLPKQVDAIVVLGGGVEGRYQGTRTLPDLSDAADRLWVGARLHKQGLSDRVVLSGGLFAGDPLKEPEAPAMQLFMLDMGVPTEAMVLEQRSRTTHENALFTRELINGQTPSVALVTSAFHMGRSVLWFEKAGFEVYPVRADVRVIPDQRQFWEYLPKPQALDESTMAIKEHLGRLQLRVSAWYRGGA
jgi:uncharacterized SAM-binding protein YcdF (DUF218 family)